LRLPDLNKETTYLLTYNLVSLAWTGGRTDRQIDRNCSDWCDPAVRGVAFYSHKLPLHKMSDRGGSRILIGGHFMECITVLCKIRMRAFVDGSRWGRALNRGHIEPPVIW